MRTWPFGFVLLLAALVAAPAVDGQVRRPTAEVAARVETKSPRPGTTVRLVAHVRLPEGLHVQSNKPRDPDLIPTEVTLTPPAGVTLVDIVYPKAEDFVIPGFAQPLAVYPNEFDIVVRVRLGTQVKAGTLSLPATLRYQACNDTVCFPPSRATVTWSVAVARG
jgi:DsbC/DsbD-like thiol-disulfide interchange protein